MQLSINCPKCGANNKFDENNIPTFCSFCGATLPDMQPYVHEAIKLKFEKQRHEMDMETEDKIIHRERLRGVRDVFGIIRDFIRWAPITLAIIAFLIGIVGFIYWSTHH